MKNLQAFSQALGAAINTGLQERVPLAAMVNALELAKLQILQSQLATAQAQGTAELAHQILPASAIPNLQTRG